MLLVIFLSLLLPVNPTNPYLEITNQINFYLDEVEDGTNVDLNFWGINELYSSNCGNNKIVSRILSQSSVTSIKQPFFKYPCISQQEEDSLKLERLKYYSIETGSMPIAIHYLSVVEDSLELDRFHSDFLKIWGENISTSDSELLKSVKNRSAITQSIIDSDNELFIYYSLLFSDYIQFYFTRDNLSELLRRFNDQKKNISSSFQGSILNYNLLKIAYETDRYSFISSIFNDLIESNYYPSSQKKTGIFSGLDYALSFAGNYSESLYLERNILLPLADHYNLKGRLDYTLLRQGANLYALGKYEEAKNTLEKLYHDEKSSIPNSLLYNNLSLCYQKLGQQSKYTSFLLQAIQEINNNESENQDYFTVKMGLYRNLFVYYNSIGDSSNALAYINRAQNLALQQEDKNEIAAIFLYLGDYYWKNYKDPNKTLPQYYNAEAILKEVDNYPLEVAALLNKTSVYIEIDSLNSAISSTKQIKKTASQNSDTPLYVEALIFEAEIANLKNNQSNLESILNEINTYPLEDLQFEVLVKYHNLVATLLFKKGNPRKAYSYFKPILEQVIERARGSVESQTGFWTVEEEYLDSFELMISILTDLGFTEQSIDYLDKLKTINDAALYNNPLLKSGKLTEKELAEEKKFNARILSLRNEYLGAEDEQKTALKTEIDKLSAQRQLISNKVNVIQNEESLPVWKLQQQMLSREMIIHYTELNNKLYVSSITKTSADISVLDLTEEIDSLLTKTANQLAIGNTSLNDLFRVYNFLELDNIPEPISQITVVPDNELYRIPLDILPTKKPNTNSSFGSSHYLIEDYTFTYFTSLQDYALNSRNTVSSLSNDFSAFAISYFDDFDDKQLPSLPYATQEARNVQKVLTEFSNKNIFTGNSATEKAFQDQLNSSKILHVATHSEVSEQDPLFSTIYLKSSENNGTEGDALYAYELFDNQLDNDLIMLNSCSSGTGNYLQGTGIMGISRALRYAGAKSLALNLWEVNDKIASDFATAFYSYLNEGYSKSEALRLTKINHINTGSADPHLWGAYTIIGNSTPVIHKPTKSQFIMPLLIIVGLFAGYKIRKESLA